MSYTNAQLAAKIVLGSESIFRVAVPGVGNTVPAANAFKELCLGTEIAVGLENQTLSFQNFCTAGAEVEIMRGANGILELSEMQWIKDDAAVLILENAAINKTQVAYEYMPEGAGAGKDVWRGFLNVKKWVVRSKSDGTVTIDNPDVSTVGTPEKGTQPA